MRSLILLVCLQLTISTMRAEATPEAPHDDAAAIAAYAHKTGLALTERINLGGDVGVDMVLVPPGAFEIGIFPKGATAEKPVRQITMSQPFYIGRYPITVAQFRRFVEQTRYVTLAEKNGVAQTFTGGAPHPNTPGISWRTPGFLQEDDHPVVVVSRQDVLAFTTWAALVSGRTVRLPSDAEFAFAARGPSSLQHTWGNTWDATKANYKDASFLQNLPANPLAKPTADNDGYPFTSPVGHYANASWCGAFDLEGNVWQWCADYVAPEEWYATCPDHDPIGPTSGDSRVMRSGAYTLPAAKTGTAQRSGWPEQATVANVGFRVVISATASKQADANEGKGP